MSTEKSSKFGFGKKKKNEEENREELSNQAFEYLCYEVTRRVQDNRDQENKITKEVYNKVSPD